MVASEGGNLMNKWLTSAAIAVGMIAIPTAASAESQWRLFGGISDVADFEYSYYGYDAEITTDSGFVIGAAYGAVYGNWVLEGELAYRSADMDQLVVSGTYYYDGSYDIPNSSVSALSAMANAWYHIPTGSNWGVYAGGGLGFASAEAEVDGESFDSTEFAWQLGAGVNIRTSGGFAYGIGYRYFNVPEIDDSNIDIESHEFVFEISSRF